jgi:hypothetical protein
VRTRACSRVHTFCTAGAPPAAGPLEIAHGTGAAFSLRMPRLLFGLASFTLVACSAPSYDRFGNGALHDGAFTYLCVSPSDAFCAGTENADALPEAIALGASFRLAFRPAPGEPAAELTVATDDFLALAPDGTITTRRAGLASVTARTPGGAIADFVDLHVRHGAALGVRGADDASTLHPGDRRVVRVTPLDAEGNALAGSATYDWETSDPHVVAVDVTDEDRARGGATLRAVGPGPARIRVVFGTLTSVIDVLVGGA